MLNGNMVAGTSKRGPLARVGKDQRSQAMARPGAQPIQMTRRRMDGCSFGDPPPRDEQALRGWLGLAVALLNTLPPKLSKSKPRRIKVK